MSVLYIVNSPNEILQKVSNLYTYDQAYFLVDSNTQIQCLSLLEDNSHYTVIEIPAGEQHKNWDTLNTILEQLHHLGASRKSLLICLGGGMVCDVGAFAASIYKRGMQLALVPTTLLAQVDAAIGGKTGIDHLGQKNLIGTFYEPKAIITCPQFLSTLPKNELLSGFAEVIKHALIGSKEDWENISSQGTQVLEIDLESLVASSQAFKQGIVQQDPQEKGLRKVLNFGHTVGHAIEEYFLETGQPILHGYAVAAGMVAEIELSRKVGLPLNEVRHAQQLLLNIYGSLSIPHSALGQIAERCLSDKKNEGGKILCTLVPMIGSATVNQEVSLAEIESALQLYCDLAG